MAYMCLRKKQDSDLIARYDSFTGMVLFFFDGKEIAKRSIKECEEIFPQYLWWQLKEEKNKYIKFFL